MLVAIFAPLLDGGIQQIIQIYRGLTARDDISDSPRANKDYGDASTSPSQFEGSASDAEQGKKAASEAA